jgi:hypothetical protein
MLVAQKKWSVIILEIATLPGLNKFRPGKWVKNILRRNLIVIGIFNSILLQVVTRCLACISGHTLGQDSSFCRTVVLPGNLNLVVRYFGIHKIPLELFTGRPGPDDGGRQVHRIRYQQLYYTPLIAFEVFRNTDQPGLISDAAEFNLITLHDYYGKNALIICKCSAVLTFNNNTYGRNALKAVGCHYHSVKLNHGILQFIELGFQGKGQAKE